MPSRHIQSCEQCNDSILNGDAPVKNTYFRLLKLASGQREEFRIADFECLVVVQSGTADITVAGQCFAAVGKRPDIWSGLADSVYCGRDKLVSIEAKSAVEVAIAGGRTTTDYPAFRIRPEEVDCVEVGSAETKSHRRIFHILGQNGAGRAGNLLVSELYCDEGCWSGYPPHKHDTDREGETAHEEVYHYRFKPSTGFGAQFWYEETSPGQLIDSKVFMTRDGDTVAFDTGFHPSATSPGHAEYIFTILVGETQRSLVQHFNEAHTHLMKNIPGIAEMRAKFK